MPVEFHSRRIRIFCALLVVALCCYCLARPALAQTTTTTSGNTTITTTTVQQGSNTVTTTTETSTNQDGTFTNTDEFTKDKDGNTRSWKTMNRHTQNGHLLFLHTETVTYNEIGGFTNVESFDNFNADGQLIDHTDRDETHDSTGSMISGTQIHIVHLPQYKKTKLTWVADQGYQEVSLAPQHQLHFWTVAIPVIAVTAIVVPLTVGHSSSTNDTNALSVHRLLNFSFQIRR